MPARGRKILPQRALRDFIMQIDPTFAKPTPYPLPCPYLAKEDSLPAWEGESNL